MHGGHDPILTMCSKAVFETYQKVIQGKDNSMFHLAKGKASEAEIIAHLQRTFADILPGDAVLGACVREMIDFVSQMKK